MRRVFFLSFFILGLTSLISQLVVIREAIISFYGNELFIGLVLGFWLIWVAIGSLFLVRLLNKKDPLKILFFCHLVIPFLFLGEILLLRLARILIVSPGQSPDLLISTLYLLVVTFPLGLIFGLQFAIAGRTLTRNYEPKGGLFSQLINWLKAKFSPSKNIASLVNQGYFYETLGLVVGGILYTLVLVFSQTINVVLLVAIVNFLILFFLAPTKKFRFGSAGFLILIIFISLTAWPINLDQLSSAWRFPNQKLVETQNSRYGNIAVTQTKDQYNFYESGLLIGSTEETFFNEEVVHLPMLYHPEPKNILLIGGGFNGALNEILKYPVDSIYYLELDPQLIKLVQNYLPVEILAAQKDPKVEIVFADAKYFIKNTPQNFDVVIINLPNPSTALLNRFYSNDFFQQLKFKLNNQAIVSLHLSSLANYISPELENLASSIYQTLNYNYSEVIILPEDNLFYLASNRPLGYDLEPLFQKFYQYDLDNQLVTRDYLMYRLTNDRVEQVLAQLQTNETAENNSDLKPVGYWYQIIFWLSAYHPKLANLLENLAKLNLKIIIISFLIGFFFIFWILDVLVKKKERILATMTALPEFSLLTIEITFIFLFQALYGYLYYQIGLIFTVILLAIALGTWMSNYLISQNKIHYRSLIHLYFGISLYFVLIALILRYFLPALEQKVVFYCLIFIVGLLVGMEFPIINKFYLEAKIEPDKKTGTIYGADLVGSSLGAIATSIFLIPVLGIIQTIIFLAFLNFLAFIALFFLRQSFVES